MGSGRGMRIQRKDMRNEEAEKMVKKTKSKMNTTA
jgi:hypothetical protein